MDTVADKFPTLASSHVRNPSSASSTSSSSKSSANSSRSSSSIGRSFSIPQTAVNTTNLALVKIEDQSSPYTVNSNNVESEQTGGSNHGESMHPSDCVDSSQDKTGPILTIPNANYHKHNRLALSFDLFFEIENFFSKPNLY